MGNIRKKKIFVAGQRFGLLVTVEERPSRKVRNRRVLCRCDCGVLKELDYGNLGRVKSCGCQYQKRLPEEVRLARLTDKRGEDECWPFLGRLDEDGYGKFRMNSGQTTAQKAAYILSIGPVDDGFQVHHKCENRSCVNPKHLQPLTVAEHMKITPKSIYCINRKKTHCPKGHPLSGDNVIPWVFKKEGVRKCLACKKLSARRWQQANKAHHNEWKRQWKAKRLAATLGH